MKLAPTAQELYDAISEFDIIDAHEHLPPEEIRLASKQDVFTLFSHYTRTDFVSAGMAPETYVRMVDPEQPLDERWKESAPFLPAIRRGSYARPAFIAAREFYGMDDITEKNYRELSERIQAENTPGIYKRVLSEKCRIKVALTQDDHIRSNDQSLLALVHRAFDLALDKPGCWESMQPVIAATNREVKNIDDYLDFMRREMARWKTEGALGIKIRATGYSNPDRKSADAAFQALLDKKPAPQRHLSLYHYLSEHMVDMAAELDLVVAVHCGMWDDFRALDAQPMIPFVQRHPNTKFDFYHLSMPNVRPCAVIAKNFPNVFLNLCWTHIISQRMTCSALDEVIDMVPLNKIIAFGGDYSRPVEKVYGHLVMAREDVASVLGRRVDEESMDLDEATRIAHDWFFENPKRIYRLDV